jgi:hypothetical protein
MTINESKWPLINQQEIDFNVLSTTRVKCCTRSLPGIQVQTCWEIGRHIVEFEQGGLPRAADVNFHWKVMIFFTIQLSGYSWIMRIIGRNNKNVEEATHWRA